LIRYNRVSKDLNHNEMVQAFLKLGCPSIDLSALGAGVPDLVVWCRTKYNLVEVKNPKSRYGKKGLNKNQTQWSDEWRGGPVYVVSTLEHVVHLANGREDQVPSYGGGAFSVSGGAR